MVVINKMVVGNAILDPVLRPLLSLPPIVSVLIISLVVSSIITFIYKLLTDQKKMKELKDDIKSHQKEMKKHRDNPKKMMQVQKKAMEKNMQYMTSSFKPTLITLLPLFLIFGWLNANMGYYPLIPNQDFNVTIYTNEGFSGNVTLTATPELNIYEPTKEIQNNKITWILNGKEQGEYLLEFVYDKENIYKKNIIITKERKYTMPVEKARNSFVNKAEVSNKKIIYIPLPFKLLWWDEGGIGWLGTYIIFSLVFSTGLRKSLKIY